MEIFTNMLGDLAGAQAREMRVLLIELCGVFWMAAEMVILFFVMEARRHVSRSALPETPAWERSSTLRAVMFILIIVGVLLAVVPRPLMWPNLSQRMASETLTVHSASLLDFCAIRRHLMVWAAFVTVWVFLECAIVYHGYLAYRILRHRLRARPGGNGDVMRRCGEMAVLLLVGTLTVGVMGGVSASVSQANVGSGTASMCFWTDVVRLSESWLYPYRNAVYLYLRLAGVVWIAVEWLAVVVLWRTWIVIQAALRQEVDRI